MNYDRLQAIVGTALVDSRFCSSLLSGSYHVLEEFDLSPREAAAVRMIKADTLQEFASQLHQWMVRQTTVKVFSGAASPSPVPMMVA